LVKVSQSYYLPEVPASLKDGGVDYCDNGIDEEGDGADDGRVIEAETVGLSEVVLDESGLDIVFIIDADRLLGGSGS
jgi:hypothetical protein